MESKGLVVERVWERYERGWLENICVFFSVFCVFVCVRIFVFVWFVNSAGFFVCRYEYGRSAGLVE